MIPFPSVPTDSLYKFKALAGLLAFFGTLFTTYSEIESTSRENIELSAQIEAYNLVNTIAQEDINLSKKTYTDDSLRYINELRIATRQISEGEARGDVVRFINKGKYYNPDEYKSYLLTKKDIATDKRNAEILAWGKGQDEQRKNFIKINQRKALKTNNEKLNFIVSLAASVIVFISLLLIGDGFVQWKKVQDMNDEITRLQLDKARKDLEGEKPKLILP